MTEKLTPEQIAKFQRLYELQNLEETIEDQVQLEELQWEIDKIFEWLWIEGLETTPGYYPELDTDEDRRNRGEE